jgi:FkbM family methyltransferase
MISYAQNFEDVMLWRALKHIERGFYIDIGAQDPVVDSVSLAFYEQGWRGVHVEPTPAYAEALRRARPDETVVQAAIGAEAALIPIYEVAGTGLSTGDAHFARIHSDTGFPSTRIEVPCIRLSDLLAQWTERDVHWMKIDVEGMEASVLRSWAPSPVRPWILVVEATVPRSPEPSFVEWEPIVLALGYRFAYFDGLNRFYVEEAHLDLLSAFAAPPNVFDAFELSGMACNAFCNRLKATLSEYRADYERSEEQRDQEFQAELSRTQKDAQERHESLTVAHRTLVAALACSHSKEMSALAEKLRSSAEREQELTARLFADLESARTLGLAQAKERQRYVEERAASEAANREMALLVEAKTALLDESAQRIANLQAELEQSRGTIGRIQLELERRLQASRTMMADLRLQLTTIRDRHERQVSYYLGELERSRLHISGLSSQLLAGRDKRAHQQLHARFASVSSHPLVVSLLNAHGDLNQITELIMDAPLFTRSSYQPTFVVNAEGVYQLEEFLILHDRSFVQAAYRAILRRDSDATGEVYFLEQIRAGESKVKVLNQILRSEEARNTTTVIKGLRANLWVTRLCEAPILGRLVSAALFLSSVNAHLRDLRVLENHVIRIAEEAQAIHESNIHKLRSLMK